MTQVIIGRLALAALATALVATPAAAAVPGVGGPVINLTARDGHIQTADANSIYMWGYAHEGGGMQYPGPTLILDEGDTVTVNLTNRLRVNVSIVFPGLGAVAATGGVPGLLTREAPPGEIVSYSLTAANPGTYTYYSGTRTDLQVQMGLVGAIVVRPAANPGAWAYNSADSAFDHEYLFLMTEVDPVIHDAVERGDLAGADMAAFWPVYWFLNGRAAPDTMAEADVPWLPAQPYNCMPMARVGEKVLLRMVGAGRDAHPLHTHGNHHRVIALDGRLLSSDGLNADRAVERFTSSVSPGGTADAIYSWTGERLGWDAFGHVDPDGLGRTGAACPAAQEAGEHEPDHCKPFPVVLPSQQELTFGPWYSGSPFLGSAGVLPPGEGGLNPNSGFFFMWHSHNEKEITNFDIFPGGMLTMFVVEHPDAPLLNP